MTRIIFSESQRHERQMVDFLSVANASVRCQEMLAEYGLTVSQVEDLTHAKAILNEMGAVSNDTDAGGPYVTRWLDPYLNQLTELTSFWLFLRDESGRIVGKTGNRLDRIGREPFGKYAARMLRNVHREDRAPESENRFPDCAYDIDGDIAYCGDTYVDPTIRDLKIPTLLISLNYLVMSQKWGAPDWTICYLRPHHAKAWHWTKRYWQWHEGAADMSFPASSEYRGLWFGMLDRNGFDQEVTDARNLAFPEVPESPRRPSHVTAFASARVR